jgi:hypothetical protein
MAKEAAWCRQVAVLAPEGTSPGLRFSVLHPNPHNRDLDMRELVSKVSNRFEHGKFDLNFVCQCKKKIANLYHTIEK